MKVSNLFEKFSNVEGTLTQDVLSFFENAFKNNDRKLNSKFTFIGNYKLEGPKISEAERTVIYIILNQKKHDGGSVKLGNQYINQFEIEIGTGCYKNMKLSDDLILQRISGVLAHELTHISQTYNGALKYSQKQFLPNKLQAYQDSKKVGRKITKNSFYLRNHSEVPTEQEAMLVKLFYTISTGNSDEIARIFQVWDKYWKFDYKQFIIKAAGYGLTNAQLVNAKASLQNDLEDFFVMMERYPEKKVLKNDFYNAIRKLIESPNCIRMFNLQNWANMLIIKIKYFIKNGNFQDTTDKWFDTQMSRMETLLNDYRNKIK
jgi:hypothetical protein